MPWKMDESRANFVQYLNKNFTDASLVFKKFVSFCLRSKFLVHVNFAVTYWTLCFIFKIKEFSNPENWVTSFFITFGSKTQLKCRQNAAKMPPKCRQNAAKMPPKCRQNDAKMPLYGESNFLILTTSTQIQFSQSLKIIANNNFHRLLKN